MKKGMSFLRKNSIQGKMFWRNSIVMALALITALVVMVTYFSNIFKNMVIDEMQSGSDVTKMMLDEIFEKYNGVIKSIETDERIYEFITDGSAYNWDDYEVFDRMEDYNYTCRILTNLRESYDLYDIELVGKSEYRYTSRGAVEKISPDTLEHELSIYSRNNDGYGFWEEKDNEYLFYCKSISDKVSYGEKVGLVTIYLEKDYLRKLLGNSCCDDENICFISNSDGNFIVSSSNDKDSRLDIYKDFNQYDQGLSYVRYNGRSYCVYNCSAGYGSLNYTSVMPVWAITDKFIPVIVILSVIMLVILILSLLISRSILFKVTKGLSGLINSMVNIKNYKFDYVEYGAGDTEEMVLCIQNYNSMLDDLKKLFEAEKRLRYLEQKLLVEQVNPHFFYNTLEMINDLANQNGVDEISNLLQYLSKFYRRVLNNAEDACYLKDELDTAETYCMIQKHRFDNAIELLIDVDESLFDIKVIKMLIQPIIENAVKYNAKYKKQYGLVLGICILGYVEGDYIVISVEDDGIGIEESKCKGLLDKGSKSFGLKNLNERIKSFYGDDCGITVESTMGLGTTVKLYIKKEILK